GRLHRHGHAVRGRPRRGRDADGDQAEPRNDIQRGAGGPWQAGPPRVAPRAHVRNQLGRRGGASMSRAWKRRLGGVALSGLLAFLAFAAAGCGGGGGGGGGRGGESSG